MTDRRRRDIPIEQATDTTLREIYAKKTSRSGASVDKESWLRSEIFVDTAF